MTWPTDEAREAVREALAVEVTVGFRDEAGDDAYQWGVMDLDDRSALADAVLAALAPRVAALVRAERAAVEAERDALRATVARVEALAERWHEVGLVCECGHGLDQHNGLGCYARHSYAPLVTCECSETDDRHEEEFAVRDLRDALTEERADG